MAAAGCAGSGQGPEASGGSGARVSVRGLSLEEARCPVCVEILLEPVTMPCGHSVCLHCFRRTVQLSSLCCPRCRLRVSSWARKQTREKKLVNIELWEKVRQSYPERCRRRMEQRDRATGGEDIFRSPTQIFKAGEMRQEYEKQKIKVTRDEDTEERKKKMPRRKEECGLLHLHDPSFGVLSDSENEEPIGMRTRHLSAFVRKTSFQNSVVQRSRSCTDSDEGRGKFRAPSHISVAEKARVTHSFNAGILLSSENSRSFSAPILLLDKRHHWRSILASPASSLVPHTKPERSISPESNDSISEELNHFKPIVCSPCTPPKRLPDGRLMEPTIVKSTPRNLTQSLQKTTSYEASPTILQKWKQIEIDRQCIKVTSKGTITSPVAEDLSIKQRSGEETESKICNCASAEKCLQKCTCSPNSGVYGNNKEKSLSNKRRLVFDPCSREDDTQSTANAFPTMITLKSSDAHKSCDACETRVPPLEQSGNFILPICDKYAGVSHCNQGTKDLKNESTVRSCLPNRPTSRKGKKRSQKTKHLELTGKIKIARTESCDTCEMHHGESDFYVTRMNQERKDRELALKLQRQFDKECQIIERHKTSSDKYSLRSWVAIGGRTVHNARRSGRISRRVKHFNSKS